MIPAVLGSDQSLHHPDGEVWVGVRIRGTEVPERTEVIALAVTESGREVIEPTPYPDDPLLAVHDPGMVRFLAEAWDEWERSEYPTEPGQHRVVPYVFGLPGVVGPGKRHHPKSIAARAGLYAMDTMTLIGPGSWEAIRLSAWSALTATDLVLGDVPLAYAVCRPPGHHAGTDFFGGSCYLNNAAIAAQRMIDGGVGTVGIVDLDAHHGNGTQQIFYHRGDVRYASTHVDPAAGWFPHFVGHADEVGADAGRSANLNVPLAPGSDDPRWGSAVERLCEFVEGCDALVVSLGVDAAAGDPESPLLVTSDGYRRAGATLADMGLPTVVVQEGGYHLPTLGRLVVAFLDGLETGAAR